MSAALFEMSQGRDPRRVPRLAKSDAARPRDRGRPFVRDVADPGPARLGGQDSATCAGAPVLDLALCLILAVTVVGLLLLAL